MRHIIVTGGAGFVGSHLVERLLADDHKVYVIDNLVRTNGLRNLRHLTGYEFIHADVSTFDFSKFGHVDEVYHLASPRINRSSEFNREGHDYIATAGFNIVDFCEQRKAKLFFASSASVYNRPKRLPIFEDDSTSPHTIYGAGKLYTENLIRSYDQMYDFDYTINRFFSVYGVRMDCEGVYTEVIFSWLDHLARNMTSPITVYGNPDEKVLDLVYVSDVVDAIQTTFHQSNKEIFNVSTEHGVTLAELMNVIQTVTGKTFNVIQKEDTRTDVEKKRVGSTKKLRNLGWSQRVSLEEGISKTWEWIIGGVS